MRIAIQGITGSFHDQAAKDMFPGNDLDIVPCNTFRSVFDTVVDRDADYGIVAVENSLHGPLNQVYRLLAQKGLWVCGEIRLHIELYLIGANQLSVNELNTPDTEVYSHPAALSQCEEWLNKNLPHAKRTESNDTAGAVEYIMQTSNNAHLAIANRTAAKLHNATILTDTPINDDPENYTRFFLLSQKHQTPPNANRTSIILTEKDIDKPGKLYDALGLFQSNNINLSKLDSHPLPGKKRCYAFYLDFDESLEESTSKHILEELKKLGWNVQVLGSYRASNL